MYLCCFCSQCKHADECKNKFFCGSWEYDCEECTLDPPCYDFDDRLDDCFADLDLSF